MRLPAAAALVAGAVVSLAAADASDRVSRVMPLAAGTPINVDATIADVTIAGSARSDLQVDVERRAPSRDALVRFPVAVDARADGIHISARQDGDARDAALKSVIVIGAPVDAVFETVRVFEGSVRVQNLNRACDVALQRGTIEAVGVGGRVRLDAGPVSTDVTRP